jgi:large subunit ribosomal protein L17
MRHRKKFRKLGRTTDKRTALLTSLAESLLLYESIRTTEAKAKELRSVVEKAITKAKVNNLPTRRALMSIFKDHELVVKKLLEIYGPRYATRPGGFMKTFKLGPRPGDGAPMMKVTMLD